MLAEGAEYKTGSSRDIVQEVLYPPDVGGLSQGGSSES